MENLKNMISLHFAFLDPRFKHHFFSETTTNSVKARVITLLVEEMYASNPGRVSQDEEGTQAVPPPAKKERKFSVWKAVESVIDKKPQYKIPQVKPKKNWTCT